MYIPTQNATSIGSNSSLISVSTGSAVSSGSCTSSGATCMGNTDNDSNTIGNTLKGYYYDSTHGFFKLNWSANANYNVRATESTDKCSTTIGGYGYRFRGYAMSEDAGLINFSYSDDIYVYYCEKDQKLHGYAYSEDLGFQNFEGIGLTIAGISNIAVVASTGSTDPFFVNNSTLILQDVPQDWGFFQGEKGITDVGKEVLFYIIK